jgi:hypothetical protein
MGTAHTLCLRLDRVHDDWGEMNLYIRARRLLPFITGSRDTAERKKVLSRALKDVPEEQRKEFIELLRSALASSTPEASVSPPPARTLFMGAAATKSCND